MGDPNGDSTEITDLREECARLLAENAGLRSRLEVAEAERQASQFQAPPATHPMAEPTLAIPRRNGTDACVDSDSPVDAKLALFRDLFHGRQDVFAVRWQNMTGRSGYAPSCAHEWDRAICAKPKVKCADCPSRALLPVTDDVIRDHLTGRHTVGVYPLLTDDGCRFLALDFDKAQWRRDIEAFSGVCAELDVPTAVEVSRSGNGAHVWVFFTEAIAEAMAATPPEAARVIVATGRCVGEGFDDARLDTLFLAMPVAWRGTLQQYAGRLHREHAGKADVIICDYVDAGVPVLARMHHKRIAGYRAMGYSMASELTAATGS